MDTAQALGQHTSSRFNADLEHVRADVLAMGGVVERQLDRALQSLLTAHLDMVEAVNRDERQVNQQERALDEECSRILATRAPTALDLRMVVAIMKMTTDLERVGDEAQKLAAIAARVDPQQRLRLRQLGDLVLAMLRDALDAMARLDATRAFEVMRRDRAVDEEYDAIQRQAVTLMMEAPQSIRRTLDVMWAVRRLERIGDHAKNICEHVVYAVLGKDVRHLRHDDVARDLQLDTLDQ
jgi:phosphate transport system protein